MTLRTNPKISLCWRLLAGLPDCPIARYHHGAPQRRRDCMTVLITGGLGFIGLNTARAFLAAGQNVVLSQYRVPRVPDFVKAELGKRAFIEQLDVTESDRLLDIGRRHQIDHICHLAGPGYWAPSLESDFRINMMGLLNVLEAARVWEVKRLTSASSVAVYNALPAGPFREEMSIPLTALGPIECYKKAEELTAQHYADRTKIDVVLMRIAGIWGPLDHTATFPPIRLLTAAARGVAPGLAAAAYAENAMDLCYVKDCARGIVLLQLAGRLANRVYNLGGGRATSNGEMAAAIRKVVPDAQLPVEAGRGPGYRDSPYMDLARIKADASYEPEYYLDRAVGEHVAWLRANPEWTEDRK
jgi:UDP-glucose 4-epimerase